MERPDDAAPCHAVAEKITNGALLRNLRDLREHHDR